MSKKIAPFLMLIFVSSNSIADKLEDSKDEQEKQLCEAIFQDYSAKHPYDLSQCTAPQDITPTLRECEVPEAVHASLPTTHIFLALDASGSMAGSAGAKSKMQVAKSEAHAFLRDLHNTAKVSLVVYGHRGDGTDERKAESCQTIEMVHSFASKKAALTTSINQLQPAGWTPLAGVLDFIRKEVAQLDKPAGDKQTVPVVYLISDGKETCDGDPVEAARKLAENEINTTIHTIGFAADQETQAQLKAISKISGGKFYPADSARALRDQLNAIKDAENKLNRYHYCVNINTARISGTYQRVARDLQRCYFDHGPAKFVNTLQRESAKAPAGSTLKQCNLYLFRRSKDIRSEGTRWLTSTNRYWLNLAVEQSRDYQQQALERLRE